MNKAGEAGRGKGKRMLASRFGEFARACTVFFVAVVSCAMLSCTVMSTNLSQEARSLRPGVVRGRAGFGVGIDYASAARNEGSEFLSDTSDEEQALYGFFRIISSIYFQGGLQVGCFPNTEFAQSIWIPLSSANLALGGRSTFKITLTRDENPFQLAIAPSAAYLYSESSSVPRKNFWIMGGELPLIFSYDVGRFVTPLWGAAGSFNRLQFLDSLDNQAAYGEDVLRLSTFGGAVVHISRFSVTPELGLNVLAVTGSWTQTYLSFGICFGFESVGRKHVRD